MGNMFVNCAVTSNDLLWESLVEFGRGCASVVTMNLEQSISMGASVMPAVCSLMKERLNQFNGG